MKRTLLAPLTLLLAVAALAPASAQATVYSGKLQVLHADDFRHGRSQTTWTLRTRSGKRVPVVPTRPTTLRSGTKVTVRGRKSGRFILGSVHRRGAAPLHAATALGNHKVAVILIKFDSSAPPWTRDEVDQRIFTDPDSTAGLYAEESDGAITISGDVHGWYTVAGSPAACDFNTWTSQADAAASADGVDLNAYSNTMYVFPYQSSCGWAGLGMLPGPYTWLNGYIEPWVAAHELGHNLGLHHASSYTCTNGTGAPVTLSSTCTAQEYGDPFDVMGDDAYHSNAWHLNKLGVVRPSEVQTAAASGSYTVRAAQGSSSDPVLLRVPAGNGSGRYYDLSIRQADTIFDRFGPTAPVTNGLSVHYDPSPSTITQSLLLDAKPGVGGFQDSSLAQGSTFANGSVSITATSVGPGTATVSVVMDTPVDSTPPSAPSLVAGSSVPGKVDVAWSAATDNVGVTGYRVYRDDVLVANTPTRSWTDPALLFGSTHKYRVSAFDAAGNSAASNIVYATVASPPPPDPGQDPGTDPGGDNPQPPGDKTAPVVRVISPGNHARLRRRAVIAARASDNVGVVRLELSVDGLHLAVENSGRIKRTWSLKGVRPGNHLIMVRAYDAEGNYSRRLVRVRVLKPRNG